MNISSKEIEQIEAYLRQELKPQEQQALEARMASDPAFRSEVELLQQVFTAASGDYPMRSPQEQEALRRDIQALEKDAEIQQLIHTFEVAEQATTPKETKPQAFRFPWLLAVVLALIVVSGLGYYAYTQHAHNTYIQRAYEGTSPINPNAAGGENVGGIKKEVLRAERLFFNKEFPQVLAVLDTISRYNNLSNYYRGHAHFNLGQYTKANEAFQLIDAYELGISSSAHSWHTLLARLGAGEDIEQDLEAFIKRMDNYKFLQNKAIQLKSDLKDHPFWTQFGNFVSRWID